MLIEEKKTKKARTTRLTRNKTYEEVISVRGSDIAQGFRAIIATRQKRINSNSNSVDLTKSDIALHNALQKSFQAGYAQAFKEFQAEIVLNQKYKELLSMMPND